MRRSLLFGLLILFMGPIALPAQTFPVNCGDGTTIIIESGTLEPGACGVEPENSIVKFRAFPFYTTYVVIVTDQDLNIIALTRNRRIDFSTIPGGNYRVYGLFYNGRLIAKPGMNAGTDILGGQCYGLTDNFLEVRSIGPEGSLVSNAAGLSTQTICTNDPELSQVVNFATASESEQYQFIVTDEQDVILALPSGDSYDFATTASNNSRVYGLASSEPLALNVGDNLPTEAELAAICADLSDNFLSVIKENPTGGTLSFTDGSSSASVCTDDNAILSVENTGTENTPYVYIITDANDNSIRSLTESNLGFSDFTAGNYRIYGAAFTGDLSLTDGADLLTSSLSDGCFDLSDNFLSLEIIQQAEGGNVLSGDGQTSLSICANDPNANQVVDFATTSAAEVYRYVITDDQLQIRALPVGNSFDFTSLEPANYQVYGLALSAPLDLNVGDLLPTETSLNENCSARSDNFLSILIENPDGSTLSFTDGDTKVFACDYQDIVFPVEVAEIGHASYVYIITSNNDRIIDFTMEANIDFNNYVPSRYKIYGAAYTGNLILGTSGDILTMPISDGCFDLSDNFLRVKVANLESDDFSLADGSLEATLCRDFLSSAVLEFTPSEIPNQNKVYLITDTANVVVNIAISPSIDFSTFGQSDLRVWCLAYSGNLLLQTGDQLGVDELSSECAQVSEQFVSIRQEFLDSGPILLEEGSTEATICLEADQEKTFNFNLEGLVGGQRAILITDGGGTIINQLDTTSLTINPELPTNFSVYGLVYTGNLINNLGNNIANNSFSDACFELSTNAVEFKTISVEGGSVQLDNGATSTEVCVMDQRPDKLTFDALGVNPNSDYRFVLTNEQDEIILALSGNGLDFDVATAGNSRVYGVSYAGNWIAQGGQNILESPLADLCFDVSDNFIEIIQLDIDAGTLSFTDGSSNKILCSELDNPALDFQTNSPSNDNYTYFLTNTDNEIIAGLGAETNFDFDQVNLDTTRIWGVAYTGQLNIGAATGVIIDDFVVSDACYDISQNFLTVVQSLPVAGQLTFTDGSTDANFCSQESSLTVAFSPSGQLSENYAYLITDQLNVIQAITTEEDFDFSSFDLGIYRIWGLAYSGDLTAQVGDLAPEATLSDACFALTDQVLTVEIDDLDGGTLMLSNGETAYYICSQLDEVVLSLADNQASGENFIYLVIGPDQRILALSETPQFNLTSINSDEFTLRGLSYNGDLQVGVGDLFEENLVFSNECYDLSENDIFVGISILNGGGLGLADNTDEVNISCNLDNQNVEILGTPDENYVYFVADDNNGILLIQENRVIDFTSLPNGVYTLFGAAYSGELSLRVGQNANTAEISKGCFARAANTITVNKNIVQGGTINGPDDNPNLAVCVDGNGMGSISIESQNAIGPNYIFLVTDLQGQILQSSNSNSFTVDFGNAVSLNLYGMAYAGNLTTAINTGNISDQLADDCFDLSDNALTLVPTVSMGGQITADGQSEAVTLCSDDPRLISLQSVGASSIGTYSFMITSEDDEFLSATTDTDLDFSTLAEGTYHIWGVHTLGDLGIRVGDDVTNSSLSDNCFDLSDNFIAVVKSQPLGGIISTIDGADLVYACPGQNNPKLTEFETINTQNTGSLAYLLVDNSEVVLAVLGNPIIDLDTLPLGTYSVYSVTYQGELLISTGSLLSDNLASSCATLSTNKVDLVIETPVGGTISGNGTAGNKICINNIETLLQLEVEGQSINTAYTYLLTNDRDQFLFAVEDTVDLDVFFDGALKVWGLAYTGSLSIQVLQDVKTNALSDDCYALSQNVLTIVKEDIDGGTVATAAGANAAFACPGDGNPDIIQFSNTSTSGTADYVYIITTLDNNILRAVDGNERDFDNIGAFRELRVWGVSYTGTLNTPIFADLFDTPLSDGCFDISNNFLPIFREEPEAADIGTSIGDQNISLCPGATPDTVVLTNTSTSLAGYAYLLVDITTRSITQILTDSQLIIRNVPLGNYQLFGLSYTGDIIVQVGDPFSDLSEFTDNCHELTANAINVFRGGEVDGGSLSTTDGTLNYNICSTDILGAIIPVVTPESIFGTAYRLVITDGDNQILFPDIQDNNVNFNGAMPGEYRIWGISLTGEYRGQFGLDVLADPLSTECYTTSDNFISVIIADPDAGQVSTSDGLDSIVVNTDDNLLIDFQNTAAGDSDYRYVLADASGVILQISETNQLDFTGLSDGNYQVYGLSTTGSLQAEPGDLITDTDLASDCFALSENSVTVVILSENGLLLSAELQRQSITIDPIEIQVYPNPVRDRTMIQFNWNNDSVKTVVLRIVDQNGRILQQQPIPTQAGQNHYELNLSSLPQGLFMIQLQGGQFLGQQRLIKVQ